MPYRPLKGRPTPKELRLAVDWLRKNDVEDESGIACQKAANLLKGLAGHDERKMELHTIGLDSPELRDMLAALDSEGLLP